MSDFERAKLIPVSGTDDTPDMNEAIDVQFNPISLKVCLSNTLKTNENQGTSRAAQFVDRSSSTLAIELVFDTTYVEAAGGEGDDVGARGDSRVEQGSDVRQQTKKIADKFLKPVESGSQMQAPSRVLFQWGSFEFVGMVQTYDETLDFFSPQGRPLRATLALKLSEDRYQFRSNDSDALAAEQTPTLSFTGNSEEAAPDQQANPVPGGSGDGPGWRDNALFNGIESPRLPAVPALALPSVALGASAGFGITSGLTASSAPPTSTSAAARSSSSTQVSPAFKYGKSVELGTGVPGAFAPNPSASRRSRKGALNAVSVQQPSEPLRAAPAASRGSRSSASPAATTRQNQGVTLAALLKAAAQSGVGFD